MHLINPACHINDIKTELQQSLGLISLPPSQEGSAELPQSSGSMQRAQGTSCASMALVQHWGQRDQVPTDRAQSPPGTQTEQSPRRVLCCAAPSSCEVWSPVSVSASMNLCVSPFPGQGLRVPVMVTVPMVPLGTGVAVPEWG